MGYCNCRLIVSEFTDYTDPNAKMPVIPNITFYYQRDNERASYFLDRALDFPNKREDVQKGAKGEDARLADVDQNARENIIISKAALSATMGDYIVPLIVKLV